MDYIDWKYRGISFFKEEFDDNREDLPSIKNFCKKGIYSDEIREGLRDYLNQCPVIISTTHVRTNIYTKEPLLELSYFTDGEFIFSNSIIEYIKYDDFAIPSKWFDIISIKNFVCDVFSLDYEKIVNCEVDIFKNFETDFTQLSEVKKVIG